MIRFTAYGTPAPAGSKRGFPLRAKGGKIVGVRMTDDSKRGKPWQAAVRAEAAEVMAGAPLLNGPLEVTATFHVRRPKGHYGVRGLRPAAPGWPAVKPDAAKLWRAVADALTGVVWRDDAQVVVEHVTKQYGEPERVDVSVAEVKQVKQVEAA